jgi:hypothetical protein
MKLKFVPNFISQNKRQDFLQREFFKACRENKQFSVLLKSIKGAFYKVFVRGAKPMIKQLF